MKRIALVCAVVLATIGVAACADYYGADYGYGRTHYGYYGGGYYDGGYYRGAPYNGGYYTPGYYDRYGNYHPPIHRGYRYGY